VNAAGVQRDRRVARGAGVTQVRLGRPGEDRAGRVVPVALDRRHRRRHGGRARRRSCRARPSASSPTARVERADDRARGVAAERVRVDPVRERRPDVVVDEDGRVLDGVLDQLLRVHHDRGALDHVEGHLRVLGAGRGLRAPSATVATVGRPTYSVSFSRLPLTRRMRRPGMPATADWRLRPRSKTMPAWPSGRESHPRRRCPREAGLRWP
jgi:hypothetical protein